MDNNYLLFSSAKGIRIIPSDIDQFYYVSKISIYSSMITILPVELFNLDLKILFLIDNLIKVLPREIKKLTNLWVLDISSNMLSKLPKEIYNLNPRLVLLNNNKYINVNPNQSFEHNLKMLWDAGYID